jgi:hypothetical protein
MQRRERVLAILLPAKSSNRTRREARKLEELNVMKTSPNYTNDQILFCRCEKFRRGPIAVVSGLLNSKKLLRCTFGDNLERRPKC